MNKTICVINGKGGIGKDTLIDALAKENGTHVYNISSIDPIRDLCMKLTKGCDKDLAQRKLLSDVKKAADEYYKEEHGISYTQEYLKNGLRFALRNADVYDYDNTVIFVHIREPENIKEFLEMANSELCLMRDEDTKLTTLLVESKRAQENYGNSSDENVACYNYDYKFISNNDIETDTKAFVEFFKEYVMTGKEAPVRNELSQELFDSMIITNSDLEDSDETRISFQIDTVFEFDEELLRVYNERNTDGKFVKMPEVDKSNPEVWINTDYTLEKTENGYKGYVYMSSAGSMDTDYEDFYIDSAIKLTDNELKRFITALEVNFMKDIDSIFKDAVKYGEIKYGKEPKKDNIERG